MNAVVHKQSAVPTEPMEIGPACQKLTPRQFRFAVALVYEVPPGTSAPEAAAIVSGYSIEDRSRLRSYARKLANNPNIVAAVEELARQRLTLDVPAALDVLRKAMQEQFGKDKVKAAQILLDRVLPVKQELKVTAETSDHTKDAIAHLKHLRELGADRELLIREFGEIGLARWEALLAVREAAKPIDAEFTVIEAEQTPIALQADHPAGESTETNPKLEEIGSETEETIDDDEFETERF